MLDKFVYHGSEISGLKKLNPQQTVRGVYLFAAKDKIVSAIFLTNKNNNSGDLTYWKSRNPETGKIAIVERYKNAFKYLYEGVSGSIYVLSSEGFLEGKTGWDEEVVSEISQTPIEEIRIKNIYDYLKKLENDGLLEVYEYPNRPKCVPKNDNDLIWHAIRRGPKRVKRLIELHPHLAKRSLLSIIKDDE
ncbi:MAG: hypothetical protein ACOX7D_00365 [Alphaproteobacteria bacterium]|jgi:hypothetical protein